MRTHTNLGCAFGLGIAAGMRTTVPLAVAARRPEAPRTQASIPWLRSRTARRVLPILAAGELVVDKLPGTPDRTIPPALLGRLVSGAVCGAAVAGGDGRRWVPALAGAAGALIASHLMLRVRLGLSRSSAVPDPVWALAEDAAAIGLARRLIPPER